MLATPGVSRCVTRLLALLVLALAPSIVDAPAHAAPEGQMTWAVHFTISPAWFDPHRVRFRLKEAWPDFLAFYATPATGAAWIVPKKYVEKVGDEVFRRAPVGAGPYRLVSVNPGVEMVLEAHDGYWRKTPAVKRLVFRMVPDESTRLAMLKRGEVDIAHALRGALGEEVRRTAGLKLLATVTAGTFFVTFTAEQWDPKSPWHDQRVRLAASVAIDRRAISQAETLGFAKASASIVPSVFEFAWPAPPIPYDPERPRKL